MLPTKNSNYAINLGKLEVQAAELVGNHAVQIAELIRQGVNTPVGFVVTTVAFDDFISAANLVDPLGKLLKQALDHQANFASISQEISDLILKTSFPSIIIHPITHAYNELSGFSDVFVAVKPSWVLPDALIPTEYTNAVSLNVKGQAALLYAIKKAWCGLFTPDALRERALHGYPGRISTGVIVQRMVQAEASGKAFTANPIDNNPDKIVVEAVFGLGTIFQDPLVQPDIYLVEKSDLLIVEKIIASQPYMLIRKGKVIDPSAPNLKVDISPAWQRKQKLDDHHILKLAAVTKKLGSLHTENLEVHWGLETGEIFVVSVEPVKTYRMPQVQLEPKPKPVLALKPKSKPILTLKQKNGSEQVDIEALAAEVTQAQKPKLTIRTKQQQLTDIEQPRGKLFTDIVLDMTMASADKITALQSDVDITGAFYRWENHKKTNHNIELGVIGKASMGKNLLIELVELDDKKLAANLDTINNTSRQFGFNTVNLLLQVDKKTDAKKIDRCTKLIQAFNFHSRLQIQIGYSGSLTHLTKVLKDRKAAQVVIHTNGIEILKDIADYKDVSWGTTLVTWKIAPELASSLFTAGIHPHRLILPEAPSLDWIRQLANLEQAFLRKY